MSPDLRSCTALGARVREQYAEGQTDYSLEPSILTNAQGIPVGRIKDGDTVIFCCRRGEREIQLTEAFTEPAFERFSRPHFKNLHFIILTLYHEKFKDLPVAFAPAQITDTLPEVVSRAGLRQLHTSESEKFAHVTFFFNGNQHQSLEGEDDICIPSPKGLPFEHTPELSLPEVVRAVSRGIDNGYDFVLTNFANGDVIGHTSNNDAKIKCASLVDFCLGQTIQAATAHDYVVMITADHGNLEEMIDPEGAPHVSHTANPVPFILLDPRSSAIETLRAGKLADVAPTILSALGLQAPAGMTGTTLAPGHEWGGKRRVLLVILDGWGIGRLDSGNPIFVAATPVWDELIRGTSNSQLQAAGDAVGLQPGKAGNSEAGHMNLGAGRVIVQDDVRLDHAMQDGSFDRNEIFCRAMEDVRQRGTCLHLIGLLTEKSSHGSIEYPIALLRMAKEHGLSRVYLHVIFDGRSTQPGSAPALLEQLECRIQEIGVGLVATGMGRALALDRDGNYNKTQQAFDALVLGKGHHYSLD